MLQILWRSCFRVKSKNFQHVFHYTLLSQFDQQNFCVYEMSFVVGRFSIISFHWWKKWGKEDNKAVPYYRRADANLVAQLPRSWFHRSRRAEDTEGPTRRENEKKFKGIVGSRAMRDSNRPRISLSPEIPFSYRTSRSLRFTKLPLVFLEPRP